MRTLPVDLLPFIVESQPFFSKPFWENAQLPLTGAILAIGKRAVTACLRIMWKSEDPHFQNFPRVLNRAKVGAGAQLGLLQFADQDPRSQRDVAVLHRRLV